MIYCCYYYYCCYCLDQLTFRQDLRQPPEQYSLQWVARHNARTFCQKLTSLDTFEDVDSHLDIANIGCMIFQGQHYHLGHYRIGLGKNKTNELLEAMKKKKQLTMLLATLYIFRPIATVSIFIVQ